MHCDLLLLVAIATQKQDPTIPASAIPGTYVTSTGFVADEVELRENHSVLWHWTPDHPGEIIFSGWWRYDGTRVTVRIQSKDQKFFYKFVPVRWGHREYLVDEEEIRDFAGRAMSWWEQNRDERSQRSELFRAPLIKGEKFEPRKRFGRPIAPKEFAPWFDWGPV